MATASAVSAAARPTLGPDSQKDFLWHQDFRLAGWAWPVFHYQPGCLVALQHGFSPVSKKPLSFEGKESSAVCM